MSKSELTMDLLIRCLREGAWVQMSRPPTGYSESTHAHICRMPQVDICAKHQALEAWQHPDDSFILQFCFQAPGALIVLTPPGSVTGSYRVAQRTSSCQMSMYTWWDISLTCNTLFLSVTTSAPLRDSKITSSMKFFETHEHPCSRFNFCCLVNLGFSQPQHENHSIHVFCAISNLKMV